MFLLVKQLALGTLSFLGNRPLFLSFTECSVPTREQVATSLLDQENEDMLKSWKFQLGGKQLQSEKLQSESPVCPAA